jgi:hypothetical protein
MIYSVTINNKAIADSGLRVSLQTAYIIGGIVQMTTNWQSMTKLERDGRVFFWLGYEKVLSELPMLDLKPDSLYRALKSISDDGFLIPHPDNKALKKPFYALSEKCYLLFGSDVGKKSEYSENNPSNGGNSLGKKSEQSENNPNHYGKKSETTTEKNPLYNSTIDNSTKDKEEIAIAIPSYENNSDELFSEAKKSGAENQKTETPPAASPAPTLAAPTADEKRKKVAAKKEKAPMQRTAITAEFEQRGLRLFASAKSQPSDEWYAEAVGKYGSENVWAIFRAMHDHCEATGRGYAAPANGFSTWAVSSGGFAVFNALRGYWRDTYGGEEWKALGELTKSDKAALDSLALKFNARIKQKNLLTPLGDNARQFFDNLPEKWASPKWFSLSKIEQELASIYATMKEEVGSAQRPAHSTGRMSRQEESVQKMNASLAKNAQERLNGELPNLEKAVREMMQRGEHDIFSFKLQPQMYERIAAELQIQIPSNFYN